MISEITKDRFARFRRIRRAWISLLLLGALYIISLGSELVCNDHPLYIHYQGRSYFPILFYYPPAVFGQSGAQVDYVELRRNADFRSKATMILPLIPHSPYYNYTGYETPPPHLPSMAREHWLGTDRNGRDVLARLLYGFRICMSFALILTVIGSLLGVIIGGVQGYLGGMVDLGMQRVIEIWSALPFLYVVILIGSVYGRSFLMLILVMSLFNWIGLSYYMRGEFLRLRNQNYVKVAQTQGLGHIRIFFRQILPNATTPLITILPFNLIGGITSLTALDFLGFGLQPPTPSWGELLSSGLDVIGEQPHLTIFTTIALFITLLLATFIGEGAREAFDPRARIRVE
ncbi:MAG: ABC transporter permease subunit [Leptospiraceae bacterium]|nr:ABC transporter permease subunit [Leptospiraceae bacterium]